VALASDFLEFKKPTSVWCFHHGRRLFNFQLSRRQGCGQNAFAHGRRQKANEEGRMKKWGRNGSCRVVILHSSLFISPSGTVATVGFPISIESGNQETRRKNFIHGFLDSL
jgi:hypothetical protein